MSSTSFAPHLLSPRRPICADCLRRLPQSHLQTRNATLLKRPRRPYTFTQLVTLSDGSAYLQRTTSPAPVYKSTKDLRNTAMWNPSSQKLLNVEEDEAGKLRAFRARFGRGWDAESAELEASEEAQKGESPASNDAPEDSLIDLIAGFGRRKEDSVQANTSKELADTSPKGKGGKK